jgi:hypothetical protein
MVETPQYFTRCRTRQRRLDRPQYVLVMPAPLCEATADVIAIGHGIRRDAALVAGGVAVPAGGDDVVGAVTSAVAAGDEVLGGALEEIRLALCQAVAAGEVGRMAQPHGRAAVVAAPMLTIVGE